MQADFGPIVPPGAIETATLPEESSAYTRVFAALQLLGGGLELIVAGGALLAPEPTGGARGWSIVARTGLLPGQATEAILLPSQAGGAADRAVLSLAAPQRHGIFRWRGQLQPRDGRIHSHGRRSQSTRHLWRRLHYHGLRPRRSGDCRASQSAKPINGVLTAASLMVIAGWLVWAGSGAGHLPKASIWLWLGAFFVSCSPLVGIGIVAVRDAFRARKAKRG